MKLIEKFMGEKTPLDLGRVLRSGTKNTIHNRETNKLDFITIKNLCSTKVPMMRIKSQATGLEKIFANHISDKLLNFF